MISQFFDIMSTFNLFCCTLLLLHFNCSDAYDRYDYEYEYEGEDDPQVVRVLEYHPQEGIRKGQQERAETSSRRVTSVGRVEKDAEILLKANSISENAHLSANLACGLSYSDEQRALGISPKIVGGNEALAGDFPWQVALLRYGASWGGSNGQLACGGSIISSQWILTAAHCFEGYSGKTSVNIGSTRWRSSQMEVYQVNKVIVHPKYRRGNDEFFKDIALIKLEKAIKFTTSNGADDKASVGPVCLPNDNDDYAGMASVSGWGRLAASAPGSPVLMAVEVNILEDEDCGKYPLFNDDLQICAGWTEGGKDSCSGDSGGPLVTRFGNEAIQIGIVSYGTGCAREGYPGVYTKVSANREWIKTVSGV